jgi:hypothetical protein
MRTQSGFTITEMIIWLGVALSVMMAATVSLVGTHKSWNGTADLARVQREGCIAVEAMAREVRDGSSLTVGSGGDSLSVFYWTGSYDSLITCFYLDQQQRSILNGAGAAIVDDVDSLRFVSPDGQTVSMEIYLRSDRGTPGFTGDDLPVRLSSSVVCRN